MKQFETIIHDIYELLEQGTDVSEEAREALGKALADTICDKLSRERGAYSLRLSGIGKCETKQWYEARGDDREEIRGQTYFKFIYGDLLEEMVLFLAKEAGHSVTDEQKEVIVDGVVGHIDALIDGELVDIKSASKFSFQKFKEGGKLYEEDSFGYLDQISSYGKALNKDKGHFLVINKETGEMCIDTYQSLKDPSPRIEFLKEMLDDPLPPTKPYHDKPDGKSGNRVLPFQCSYCHVKHSCWPNLRKFIYSSGPKYFTKVVKEPRVPEEI